jgi:protein subunit release factor A
MKSSVVHSTVPPTVIIEIRAAEGGADAKLLVEEQLAIYVRLGGRRSL